MSSLLVPYSQESSEESDQENSTTQDMGCLSKPQTKGNNVTADVRASSSKNTKGEVEDHQNRSEVNGSTSGFTKTNQNGQFNGHHKVNGHNTLEKVRFTSSVSKTCPATAIMVVQCDQ